MTYSFDMLSHEQHDPEQILAALRSRPLSNNGLKNDAPRFVLDEGLKDAIHTAIAVGEPLLLTGEPGTGKTQAAYYVAWRLGLGDVLHFQVKSDSSAQDLLYHFDSVRYFHDAHIRQDANLDKKAYIEPRPLWEALHANKPCVLLIDEIDKAPRDFPNDLLHELDQMSFTIKETGELVRGECSNRPLVFITSNSERRLPEAFLRRCIYHHVDFFTNEMLKKILESHHESFRCFSADFLSLAIERFLLLRQEVLRKKPTPSELLVWLKTLAADAGTSSYRLSELLSRLKDDQKDLPYLGALLKDNDDIKKVKQQRGR